MTAYNKNELLAVLLELGEEMYAAGAEVNRVEDTISRIGRAYGAVRMNVFAITSTIEVTMTFADGSVTQSRRIQSSGQTDFMKLEEYNALSRKCCTETPEPEELRKEIGKIRAGEPDSLKKEAGSVLAAGAFAVFFGGSLWDGLASAALGFLISRLSGRIGQKMPNRIIYNFIMSLITGTAAILLCMLIPSLHSDKILIGDIMLLVPGIAITNAVHDMMEGDTIAGILRITECILWTAALAFGFILPLTVKGGIL